jgi:hypothetical protein
MWMRISLWFIDISSFVRTTNLPCATLNLNLCG